MKALVDLSENDARKVIEWLESDVFREVVVPLLESEERGAFEAMAASLREGKVGEATSWAGFVGGIRYILGLHDYCLEVVDKHNGI